MGDSPPNCGHQNIIRQENIIGEVFRKYGESYIAQYGASLDQIKLISNIRKCRTAAMGALVIRCKDCGSSRKIYQSCGDSKCPICQSNKRASAQDRLRLKLLKVPYVHTTFTLPHELNPLLRANQKLLYGLLYRSAYAAVKELCLDEKNVGGLPGMVCLMHTWGSDMKYHVHLHSLITFGGLDENKDWVFPVRSKKLYRYRAINRAFRDHYLSGLEKLLSKGELVKVAHLPEILASVRKKNWVVNNGQPQIDTMLIEEYLTRYIMKIAVSNSRLSFDEVKEQVHLSYNDYSLQEEGEAAPKAIKVFDPLSFIHQFLMHLPPKSFQRIRYYGLHSSAWVKKIREEVSEKLKRHEDTIIILMRLLKHFLKAYFQQCEFCGGHDFEESVEAPDATWLSVHVRGYQVKDRSPPDALLQKVGKENALFSNGGGMSLK